MIQPRYWIRPKYLIVSWYSYEGENQHVRHRKWEFCGNIQWQGNGSVLHDRFIFHNPLDHNWQNIKKINRGTWTSYPGQDTHHPHMHSYLGASFQSALSACFWSVGRSWNARGKPTRAWREHAKSKQKGPNLNETQKVVATRLTTGPPCCP